MNFVQWRLTFVGPRYGTLLHFTHRILRCLLDLWKICASLVFDVLFLVFYFHGNGVRMNFKNDQNFAFWTDCNDFTYVHSSIGAWGGVVVKALRYYSDGPGIDSRWCHWIFQWHIPSDRTIALGSTQPLVKTSTRNIPGGRGGRCVRLTTSPRSCAECHGNLGA